MKHFMTNRFQNFFKEREYIILKNYLYNYLLRKIAIENNLKNEKPELILEVGSGISPIVKHTGWIIYSELSLTALQFLKHRHGKGWYVVADCTYLPFKTGVISHVICSEVLEHLKEDRRALKELSRVMKFSGRLIITFPHRKFYYTYDDRFVNHFRRYDLSDIETLLANTGLRPIHIEKVLGPLEKVTMNFAIFCFSIIQRLKFLRTLKFQNSKLIGAFVSFFKWINRLYVLLVYLDAKITPRALSTVLLIKAGKTKYLCSLENT